jgi:hypothetical protein
MQFILVGVYNTQDYDEEGVSVQFVFILAGYTGTRHLLDE